MTNKLLLVLFVTLTMLTACASRSATQDPVAAEVAIAHAVIATLTAISNDGITTANTVASSRVGPRVSASNSPLTPPYPSHTPTFSATSAPAVPADVALYFGRVGPLLVDIADASDEGGTLLQNPKFGDREWRDSYFLQSMIIRHADAELRDLDAPAEVAAIHEMLLDGTGDAVQGAEWILRGIDNLDVGAVQKGGELFVSANEKIVKAKALVVEYESEYGFGPLLPPTRRPTSTPMLSATSAPAAPADVQLGMYADGYDWRRATREEKIAFCKRIEANSRKAKGHSPGWTWRYMYSNLEEFYSTTEPLVLQQRIVEIAAALSVVWE